MSTANEVTGPAYLAVLLGTFVPVTFLIVLYTQVFGLLKLTLSNIVNITLFRVRLAELGRVEKNKCVTEFLNLPEV